MALRRGDAASQLAGLPGVDAGADGECRSLEVGAPVGDATLEEPELTGREGVGVLVRRGNEDREVVVVAGGVGERVGALRQLAKPLGIPGAKDLGGVPKVLCPLAELVEVLVGRLVARRAERSAPTAIHTL